MRLTMRLMALVFVGIALAACARKDKNAPLAFAPADTPYVVANLVPLDEATRTALLAQADAQLPSQLAQMDAAADRMQETSPDAAHLVHAFAAMAKGKTLEALAAQAGIDLAGHHALYGIGLAPVARVGLTDPAAFQRFVTTLEEAYGKPMDVRQEGTQRYLSHVFPAPRTQLVVATEGKQAVLALLPADAGRPLLRQALGLDRPAKSLQDKGTLAAIARSNDYKKYVVGQLDLARALPLLLGDSDPLLQSVRRARAEATAAKTGEPVANQLRSAPSCTAEAARIAARVPSASFGYTELTPRRQDAALHVALAGDITKAFAHLEVALPGLSSGHGEDAPLDVSLALPIDALRAFWSAQAEAVAAKPFTCPTLESLNDTFAALGQWMQKAALPPFGDLQGIRLAVDRMEPAKDKGMPAFSGRLVVATHNPAALFAMGQMTVPSLNQVKLAANGTPVALTRDLTTILGQPAWLAMTDKLLALGIGAGEDAKLEQTLKQRGGDAGRMARMHLSGAMYLAWLQLMGDHADNLATAAAAITEDDTPSVDAAPADSTEIAADIARSKAQLAVMQLQAARIGTIDAELHVDKHGLVVTSATTLK